MTDTRNFNVPDPEVLELITEMVTMMEKAGMGRQAVIINKKDMEIIRASRGVVKEADTDLKMMQFGSYEEAIKWLNQ